VWAFAEFLKKTNGLQKYLSRFVTRRLGGAEPVATRRSGSSHHTGASSVRVATEEVPMSGNSPKPNDDRANVKNPNNPAHEADRKNRIEQGHPNPPPPAQQPQQQPKK